jgi:hypothetical protein
MALDPSALAGPWVHAHEEDEEGRMVFRRPDEPLPPSRGRLRFDLQADGSATVRGIAPADGPALSPGRWRVEGSRLLLASASGETLNWDVESLGGGRLVLRPEA